MDKSIYPFALRWAVKWVDSLTFSKALLSRSEDDIEEEIGVGSFFPAINEPTPIFPPSFRNK